MSKIKVWLDAGHGGKDPGALGNDKKEKDYNLTVANLVKKKLESTNKFEVGMSRTTDVYLTLEQRVAAANKFGAKSFTSIHMNSSENKTAQGVETFALKSSVNDLATNIQNAIIDAKLYNANRGVKYANFHVLRETKMRAALIEMAFISNSSDVILIDRNIDAYATSIAKGICKQHNVAYVGQTTVPVTPGTSGEKLYIVAHSAYKNIDYAKTKIEELKKQGVDMYVHIHE